MSDNKNYLDENDNELLYLVSESNDQAEDVIYSKYAPVIEYYAKSYLPISNGTGLDYNDLYQEGMLGLASAINKYNEDSSIKFSTFAFICIKRKIQTAIKIAGRKKYSILNESFSLDYAPDEKRSSFENTVSTKDGSIDDILITREQEKYVSKKVNETFNNNEKTVYELKLNGLTLNEISKLTNKSYKSVESTLFRIRTKLKKILSEIV